LIGSVFVPLFGVFAVRYFVLRRPSDGAWDVTASARGRWWSALPWLAGFVSYQLVNPGAVSWWKGIWPAWTAPSWLSATLVALLVSAGATLVIGLITRRVDERDRSGSEPAAAH
jgi:NCS1 family nucleobase:cation symporter-1